MAKDTLFGESMQTKIQETQQGNQAGCNSPYFCYSCGPHTLTKLMARMRLRGGERGTQIPKQFRSIEATRELKMRLRDCERDLYAEPGGHVGNMLEKSLLPNLDVTNPCFKFTIRQEGRTIGSCVIEMFGSYVPSEIMYISRHLRNWKISRLRKNMLIELQYDGPPITPSDDMSNLEHSEPYLLTMKRGEAKPTLRCSPIFPLSMCYRSCDSSSEISDDMSNLEHSEPYLLTMKRGEAKPTLRLTYLTTHSMDKSHQVIGRVLKGIEVFDTLANLDLYLDPVVEGWKQPASDVFGNFESTRHPLVDSLASGNKVVDGSNKDDGDENSEDDDDEEEEEEDKGDEKFDGRAASTSSHRKRPLGRTDEDQMEEKMPRMSASDFIAKQSSSDEDSEDDGSDSENDGDADKA
eukprot:CAMPEP_0185281068 /NCGR_PEP_ID=MMETSP1359-20130426/66507_1 /TAXON_ID=552665 /ORGANISM="Bigelowiella longifila, Strain CCMP242" /LENGTH=406 /DNA_ID=CAMNT_0027876449 /DNA_START=191 /DNA_END=1414 /DNA_ORIENTATION=-